jgi:hypothetical protein
LLLLFPHLKDSNHITNRPKPIRHSSSHRRGYAERLTTARTPQQRIVGISAITARSRADQHWRVRARIANLNGVAVDFGATAHKIAQAIL